MNWDGCELSSGFHGSPLSVWSSGNDQAQLLTMTRVFVLLCFIWVLFFDFGDLSRQKNGDDAALDRHYRSRKPYLNSSGGGSMALIMSFWTAHYIFWNNRSNHQFTNASRPCKEWKVPWSLLSSKPSQVAPANVDISLKYEADESIADFECRYSYRPGPECLSFLSRCRLSGFNVNAPLNCQVTLGNRLPSTISQSKGAWIKRTELIPEFRFWISSSRFPAASWYPCIRRGSNLPVKF
jgi:hypothetical protein